jgi:hypothetical protein
LLIELLNLVAEILVLLDQPSQLGLNQVEEGIYLVFGNLACPPAAY